MTTETQSGQEATVVLAKRILPPGIAKANAAAVKWERRLALIVVLTPLVGLIAAIALLWQRAIGATELTLLLVSYFLSTLGVSIGFHRLASHRAFQTYTPIRALFTILGSTAGQGPVLFWAAIHRCHHKYSDQPGDPHSPHLHGDGFRGTLKGFWHAHVGWLFAPKAADWGSWVPDLLRDRVLFRVNQTYFLWLLLGLVLPAAVGGLIHGTWMGAFLGLLWGGLVRMFLLHHSTWASNSISHLWGTRPYKSRDYSCNNALLAVPTCGDGWHNNHHAFPTSALHGLEWWEVDPSGMLIRVLERCGLAWDVKRPSPEVRREARRMSGEAEQTTSDLLAGPTGADPTSGNYVAALDPTDHVTDAPVEAARVRCLPRGVSVARPAAVRLQRRLAAAVVVLPLLGTLAAVYQVFAYGVGVLELGILALMYTLCTLGAYVGFHRHFAHRSFHTYRPMRIVLGILGSMAAQGPLVTWVAAHRRHHAYSDRPGDPHSPNLHGGGWKGLFQGLWHAHIGWMFSDEISDWSRFARDVMQERTLFKIHQTYFTWVILGLALPAALGGLIAGSWAGALGGFLWGGLVRMFLVNNGAWAVGSICHVFGTRPFNNRDHSANNYLVAVVTFGEGLQNNHHAFPSSAAHAVAWWQPDLCMSFIRLLQGLRLVWDVKLPSRRMIEEARVKPLEAR